MKRKRKLLILCSIALLASFIVTAINSNFTSIVFSNDQCMHDHVEHYESNEEHVEHWACCECHDAWSDAELENYIGNTINNREQIDIPLRYVYNESTLKIELRRGEQVKSEIIPTLYISTLKFHGNNSNVMQFKAGDLSNYTTNDLKILNSLEIDESFNLNKETKKIFVYFSDSNTFGFQQSSAFVSYKLDSHIYCKNLILKDNDNYFVIGSIGTVFSENQGTMKNISGIFENKIINAMESGGNYYVDIACNINTTFWSISGNEVGTDWTYSGGTSYLVEKVHNDVTSVFAHVDSSVKPGNFPQGIKQATLFFRNCVIQNLRLGFSGENGFSKNDKLILKAGSIFTDDSNGNNAVYVNKDIEFIFTGELFTLFLGNVDLSNSIGECWADNQIVLTMPNLDFDLNYFYLNKCEGEWSSKEHAVLSNIIFKFYDCKNDHTRYNLNTYNKLTYYNNNDLKGIKGCLDLSDSYIPRLNDTLTIPSNSYVTINCVGSFLVEYGVTFRLSKSLNEGTTLGWTNIANESLYDMPQFDMTKSIHIGASNDLNSSTIINHSTGAVNTAMMAGLQSAGFNLLTGNYTIIENDGHKNNLLEAGEQYGIDFILKPRNDWTTDNDYVNYNYSSFLGYEMKDEPSLSDASDFAYLKDLFDKKSYKNKYFYTNLQPIYAESKYIGSDYTSYVEQFAEGCNFNILSYDNYSLYQDRFTSISNWSKTKLRSDWLKNFSICSYYAHKNNIPFWYTFLSSQHYLSKTYRYINPSSDEMTYQMYMAMAFGATGLVHYTFEHDHSIDTESTKYGETLVNESGEFTSSFQKAKVANKKIHTWDNVYMNHKWLGVSGITGSSKTYKDIFKNELVNAIPVSSTGIVDTVSSTGDVLLSHFSSDQTHEGLMLTNFIMPSDNLTSNVTLKLNSKYKAIKVYSDNSVTFQELNDNNTVSLEIAPGSAVFITPVCKL